MKALQNFLVRTQAFVVKEQSRQLEFFQKRLQNQHNHGVQQHNNGHNGPNGPLAPQKWIMQNRSRQLLMQLRPFQRFLSSSYINHTNRQAFLQSMNFILNHSYSIIQRMNNEDEQLRRQRKNELNQSASSDQGSPFQESNFVGLTEYFNKPPQGMKEFCGKYIELEFQHVVETKFTTAQKAIKRVFDDSVSIASSYIYEEEEGNQGVNVERIRLGENPLNLTVIQSEYDFSLSEIENESSNNTFHLQLAH